MSRRSFSVWLTFMGVLVVATIASRVPAQQPTPLPFDRSLSIYAAHRGTWHNYNTAQQQQAEVAAKWQSLVGVVGLPLRARR